MIRDLTKGSILKNIVLFSLPFMAANFINTLYNLVDMSVIGNVLDSSAMAAASIAGQLTMLFYGIAMGLGNGGQVLISQYVGAKRREDVAPAIGTLTFVGLVVGLVLTVCGLIFSRQLISLLNPDPSIFGEAVGYFRICCIGLIPYYIFNMISAAFRGMGDARTPFLISAIAAGMNIVLDIFFLIVLHRGVAGAAAATVISQFCSCIFAVIYMICRQRNTEIRITLRHLIPDWAKLRLIVRLSIPLCISNICIDVSVLFVQSMINPFGVIASSVNGAGSKLLMVIQAVTGALQAAVSTFVAQNMGAGQPERVRKAVVSSTMVGAAVSAVFMAICLIMPRVVFGLFTSEAEVLDLAEVYLRINVWDYLAMGLMGAVLGLMIGVGATRLSLVVALLDGVVARIGLSVLFGTVMGMGLQGFWLGSVLSSYVTVILGWIYYLTMRWEKKKLV